jgi:hypothetical protein
MKCGGSFDRDSLQPSRPYHLNHDNKLIRDRLIRAPLETVSVSLVTLNPLEAGKSPRDTGVSLLMAFFT